LRSPLSEWLGERRPYPFRSKMAKVELHALRWIKAGWKKSSPFHRSRYTSKYAAPREKIVDMLEKSTSDR
jgi:hypothetical protein